ncbi:MAG: S1C family serine protease [Patescibacteria group bacterium]
MAREKDINRSLWLSVGLAGLCGVLGGLVSGWVVFAQAVRPELDRLEQAIESWPATGTRPLVTPTEPVAPPVEVIPVESRPITPAYPAAFAERRTSGVLTLVRRLRTATEEPISPERELGSAVAVTSDGWLVTTDAALEGVRLADLGVIVDGRVQAVESGMRDTSTGVVYLKISADGLPTTAFVRPTDVVAGAPVWIESTPRQLVPEIVLTVRARPSVDPVSSEEATRRFLVSGSPERLKPGAAVWDGAARLIGLLESDEFGDWRVIPAGPIGSSLSQMFSNGEIRRATLGVRSLDLVTLSFDAATTTLPALGAWLRPNRTLGLPAIVARGPAVGVLQEGDVIERVERDILDGAADLGERLLDYRPGATVTVSGRRRGTAFQAQITLGSEITSEALR